MTTEQFNYLLEKMSSETFINGTEIGNDIPHYICPYDPTEKFKVEQNIELLKNRLRQNQVMVLDINLYDLTIEELKRRKRWELIKQKEKSLSKDQLKRILQNIMTPESNMLNLVNTKTENELFDILFITGVGEVYPYIRSHALLPNLQRILRDKPVVLFFPGEYNGHSLNLFGLLKDDNYYRAFNIEKIEA
jgi:hypothetical protein